MGSLEGRHDDRAVEILQPPGPPKPRVGLLQVSFVAALVLAIGAGVMVPLSRVPRIVEVLPGRGVATKPYGWDEARAAFRERDAGDRGAVVFAGDSITAWWKDLADAFPGLRVANRGIAGDTSRTLLLRFEEDVAALEPRAVVILVGTNDIALGGTPSDVAQNVRDILDRFRRRRPGTPVLLCAVMPRRPGDGRFPDALVELNAQLQAIATARSGVAWCDTWTPFATETGDIQAEDFPDGLHPSPAGYAKWAAALRPALEAAGVPADGR